jgi:hypothetical protein
MRVRPVLLMLGLAACSSTHSSLTAPDTAVSLIAVDSGPSAIVGQHIVVSVRATDSRGQPVSGAVVVWATGANAGSLDATSSTTDATGTANMGWTVGTLTGPSGITAALPGFTPISITELLSPSAAAQIARVSPTTQAVTTGTVSAPMIVRVTDRYGNGVPNVLVTWTTTGGTPSANAPTDASGRATMTLTDILPNTEYDVQAHANVPPGTITFYTDGTPPA